MRDIAPLVRLEASCFIVGEEAWDERDFVEYFEDHRSRCIVGIPNEHTRELAGSVTFGPYPEFAKPACPRVLELLSLAVAARFRGQGVGAELLLKAIAAAQVGGHKKLALNVRKNNESAIRLYRKYEFVEVARNDKRFNTDDEWLRMMRPINA